MTPSVTRQKMTLAEADISKMECRRNATTGTSIPRTVCANPDKWAKDDKKSASESAELFHDILDNQDNRFLYRNQ